MPNQASGFFQHKDDSFDANLALQSCPHRLENIVIGRGEELVFRQRPDQVTVGRNETAMTGATIAVDNADCCIVGL